MACDNDELERALRTLGFAAGAAAAAFVRHCDLQPPALNWLVADPWYSRVTSDPGRRAEALDEFESWVGHCYHLIHESTKAANWCADVIRRDIDPRFFAVTGKFRILELIRGTHQPMAGASCQARLAALEPWTGVPWLVGHSRPPTISGPLAARIGTV